MANCGPFDKRPGGANDTDLQIDHPPLKKQRGIRQEKHARSHGFDIPELTTVEGPQPQYTEQQLADEELVCFGMLRNVVIQLCPGAKLTHPKLKSTGVEKGGFSMLKVVLDDDRGQLEDSEGTLLALLNKKDHRIFLDLQNAYELKYNALVKQNQLLDLLSKPRSATSAITITADILVDGPTCVADAIARKLAAQRKFLQRPLPGATQLEYQNPQYLRIKGYSSSLGFQLAPIISHLGTFAEPAIQNNADPGATRVETDPWAALDRFSVHSGLAEWKIDDRILCKLKSHQREGVDFILRSEGHGQPINSLWQAAGASWGGQNSTFKHRIVGCEANAPEEVRGGLLADAMGLGKTLMMIAAIISTLSAAENQARRSFVERSRTQSGRLPTKSTLVIVPDCLLMKVWTDEIKKHVRQNTLKIYRYHGPKRVLKTDRLLEYDIVMTTYRTVASEIRGTDEFGSILRHFDWYRLVLDEAHEVRNLETGQFKAVDALASQIRWCITGTPIQNTIDDLGALVRFLHLPHLREASSFRKHISGARKSSKPNYRNLQMLLSTICLRRHQAVLQLPETSKVTDNLVFSEIERRQYEALVEEYLHRRTEREHSDSVSASSRPELESFIRLRMFCNVGMLQSSELQHLIDSEVAQEVQETMMGGKVDMEKHCVDLEDMKSSLRTSKDFISSDGSSPRPGFPRATKANQQISAKWPTKICAIRADVAQHLSSDKSIVFSSWRRSLDILGEALGEDGISYCRFDGLSSSKQRAAVLEQFQADHNRVLLVTFGTGATGLNCLSVASRVYLMEPQWNPSVESQAIGRVVRLDQSKKVAVVRYLIQDSIEKDIERRQAIKIGYSREGGLHAEIGE